MQLLRNSAVVGAALAVVTAGASGAATVTSDVTANFSVGNQSLFGSGGASDFGASVGVGNSSSTFQFKASTGASSGTVDSKASVDVQATFDDMALLGATSNVKLSFQGASAEFDTALGAFMDVTATIRTPAVIGIPAATIPLNLVDEDYKLDTRDADSTYSFGQTLSDTDSVSLPGTGVGIGVTASANPNVDQESSLEISALTGKIVATNATSGSMLTRNVDMTGSMLDFDFTFGEQGIWNLSLVDLALDNSFESDFGLSATFTAGIKLGINCDDPSTDSDNGFGCLFDTGLSTTTSTVNVLPISPFALNYNTVNSLSLGAINVAAPVGAVPLPASAWMLLVGFGGLAAMRRRKAA
ncbi:MAG: VPLPA-CTERM sorting domain-containing protein [Pseudomonadota bacterium]